MNLGAHMSISGGIDKALERGLEIGCNAVQFFSKNNNQWSAKEIDDDVLKRYFKLKKQFNPNYIMIHDSYLINLASPKDELYEKSLDAFLIEMQRVEKLEIPYLVMHPGSHLKQGEKWGIDRVIQSFNRLFERTEKYKMKVLIETTAGQGSNLGYRFEHIRDIIGGVNNPDRLGVCVDTCHILAAGYDIRDEEGYTKTFDEFDKIVGIDKILAFHINDSKKGLSSKVDRHEHIGKGEVGLTAFKLLLNDERFKLIPMVLETPKGKEMLEDIENLKILRSLIDK